MMKRDLITMGIIAVFAASCSSTSDDSRTAITEDNELGVVSLETERYEEDGKDIFVLRAFSADGQERASVRRTRGAFDNLPVPPEEATRDGSEIAITFAGFDWKLVVPGHDLVSLPRPTNATALQFLELGAVSSALHREAQLRIVTATEAAYQAQSCSASQLLNTATAEQCCYGNYAYGWGHWKYTTFALDEWIRWRRKNTEGGGAGCKAEDGVSSCSGTSCFFGPHGFANRDLADDPAGNYAWIYSSWRSDIGAYACAAAYSNMPMQREFPDVTGSNNPGSCPGGGGSGAWEM